MTPAERADVARARRVRAILRRTAMPVCGCEHRDHDEGCLWGLGPEDRARRHAQLVADPFKGPAMTMDDELDLLDRVRTEPLFAARMMRRFRHLFGISS